MPKSSLSFFALQLLSVTAVSNAALTADPVCTSIQNSISSSSDVYYQGHPLYLKGISHWASSNTELSKCVVEPGTPEDVATVLRILGETMTPFAVKGGGHSANAGFSSTKGVHISMYRFSDVSYFKSSETVEVGSGLIWDDVYEKLHPYGVNVVGGRFTGVGVAGLILGGGYSYLTNQYGLAVDNVVAFELVTTTGEILDVTHSSDPELFFALKGAHNNFGIVTKFTLKAHPQTEVWGGIIYYPLSSFEAVKEATSNFHATVKDPKATIFTSFASTGSVPHAGVNVFYDGPVPPKGIFEDFLSIPSTGQDVKTRSFASHVRVSPSNMTTTERGVLDSVPILDVTSSLIDAVIEEVKNVGSKISHSTSTHFLISVQTFHSDLYSHTNLPSAYPWTRSKPYIPLSMWATWLSPTSDDFIHAEVGASAKRIREAAISQGQSIDAGAPKYLNYAPKETDLSLIYGPPENLERLRVVKRRMDPANVMGLAGGWKVPL